jgi:hypothetical protein
MALSSLQSHELLKLINEKVRGKRSQNSYSPLEDYNISTSTLRRYIKEMRLVEVKADTKSTARQEAHTDLRNFMALSAVLNVLYKVTSPEHVYSSDDVSIVLNGWNEKPRVLTTKEKKELLHAQHIGVSTTEATEKRHVISFNVTVGGSGDVPCIVAKIYDRRFPESMKEKPRVYNVGDNLFIMLLHSDTAETLVTSTQYKSCILPRCNSARAGALLRDLDSAQGVTSQSTVASVGKDIEAIRGSHKFMALLCDGAQPQIAAILDELYAATTSVDSTESHTLYAKYSAACSMSQQVNDVGYMHTTLHAQFKSPSFHYNDDLLEPAGTCWAQLKSKLLKHLSAASFRTYWKCLCHTADFMDKAFTRMTVKSAYRLSGVYPYNAGYILSRCPCFPGLPQDAADHVVNSIPQLADACEQHGIVPEEALAKVLEDHAACPHYAPKTKGKPLNEMVTNRQRAMVMSNANYLAALATRRAAATPATVTAAAAPATGPANANAESDTAPLPAAIRICSGPGCNATSADRTGWHKCGFPYCRQHFCPREECCAARLAHRLVCKQGKKAGAGPGTTAG